MRNTLFGLTGLGTAIICRVFWGALKRKLTWVWEKISEGEVQEDGDEDGASNPNA
jgi:hypothetical protein